METLNVYSNGQITITEGDDLRKIFIGNKNLEKNVGYFIELKRDVTNGIVSLLNSYEITNKDTFSVPFRGSEVTVTVYYSLDKKVAITVGGKITVDQKKIEEAYAQSKFLKTP